MLLSSCARSVPVDVRSDDFARALEKELASAEREYLTQSKCMRRTVGRCGDGTFISRSTGFVSHTTYFDRNGATSGSESSNCRSHEQTGVVPTCEDSDRESLCLRALAKLQRTGVTIEYDQKHIDVTDAEIEFPVFNARVRFSDDPFERVTMRITELEPQTSLEVGWDELQPLKAGTEFELPVRLVMNGSGTYALISAREHYAKR